MEKIKITIINSTGAVRVNGELCLSSGIIQIGSSPVKFSHINNELSKGNTIEEFVEIKRPVIEEAPITRSEAPKNKKRKG